MVDIDPAGLDTQAGQAVASGGEVLLVGGAPCVADEKRRHGAPPWYGSARYDAAAPTATEASHFPRSELREMNDSDEAAWSNISGTHILDVCEAITQLPSAKPEVVGAQIHDDKDDVLQVRLEGQKLTVQYDDGKSEQVLDPNYTLGASYNVQIVAADSKVDVLYNGQRKAELPLKGSGWYFKAGAYVQSNTSKGDGADSGPRWRCTRSRSPTCRASISAAPSQAWL